MPPDRFPRVLRSTLGQGTAELALGAPSNPLLPANFPGPGFVPLPFPACLPAAQPDRFPSVTTASASSRSAGGLPDRAGNPTTAAPVSVQTMTAGYTHEIDKCVAEINRTRRRRGRHRPRRRAGEEGHRRAQGDPAAVRVPIVADVHFHFQRALEAVEAGVHKIRLNPGNITDRKQVIDVIQACKRQGGQAIPIRVGVNEGSIIERKDKQKR
jgi:hypothetical protein